MEFVVAQEEVKPHLDKAYKKVRSELFLPGFRKGHVPLAMIKQRIGKQVEADAIEDLSNELFKKAVEERNIQPIGQPHLHNLDYKPGEAATIKIHYEVLPEIEPRDYVGVEVQQSKYEVDEDDVEREIEMFVRSRQTYESADRALDDNYHVTIDMQKVDEHGVPLIGMINKGVVVRLYSEKTSRELKAELLNMSTGDEKIVELTYHDGTGEEKIDRMLVTVHDVQRVVVPEATDEFIATMSKGEVKTIAQWREVIRENSQKRFDEHARISMEQQLIDEIVKRNDFDVPPSLVKNIQDDYIARVKKQYEERKVRTPIDEKAIREEHHADAIWQARWLLLREAIIKKEKIEIADADVEERAEAEALQTGIAKERLIQFYKQSEELARNLLAEKVIRFLVENARITETSMTDEQTPILTP